SMPRWQNPLPRSAQLECACSPSQPLITSVGSSSARTVFRKTICAAFNGLSGARQLLIRSRFRGVFEVGDKEFRLAQDKRVTIRDVAIRSGHAVSTVSNALADKRHVSEETKQHVKQVAAELGYRPSTLARALRMRLSSTIGVLVA